VTRSSAWPGDPDFPETPVKNFKRRFALPTFSYQTALGISNREAGHLGTDTRSACSNWELLFVAA